MRATGETHSTRGLLKQVLWKKSTKVPSALHVVAGKSPVKSGRSSRGASGSRALSGPALIRRDEDADADSSANQSSNASWTRQQRAGRLLDARHAGGFLLLGTLKRKYEWLLRIYEIPTTFV